jgi:hypothetical protein
MSGITLNLLGATFGTPPVGYLAVISNPDGTGVTPANVIFNSSHVYLGVQTTSPFPDSFSKATVLKLTPEGSIVWQTGLTDALDYYTVAAITSDASGNIILAGAKHDNTLNNPFGAAVKFNSSGVLQWKARIESIRTQFYSVACDSSENIYCGGYIQVISGRTDSYITKFDSSGTLLFARQIGDSGTFSEESTAQIATDGTHIYTIGSVDKGNPDGGNDRLLCSTGLTANSLYFRDAAGAARQDGSAICTDGTGISYIAVRSYATLSSGSRQVAMIARVNYATGTFTWQTSISFPSISTDIVGMCLNAAGNSLYVCGTVYGAPTQMVILKINTSNGILVWGRTLSSTTANITGTGITIDASENIYLLGASQVSGGPQKTLVLKMPGDGTGVGSVTVDGATYSYAVSTGTYSSFSLQILGNTETNAGPSHTTSNPSGVNSATSCVLALGEL